MNKKLEADTSYVTRPDKLFKILSDGRWHSTGELIRRVSHTFAHAKFLLCKGGVIIEKRPHPVRKRQYQYRYCAKSTRL